MNLMNGIENLNFFQDKNSEEENNVNNNKNGEINYFNNNDMNLLVKSLIFVFSRKMSFVEDKINKINSTLEQFSENNLIFYQSINDELQNINDKILNLNNSNNINNTNNDSTSNKNSTIHSNNNINNNTFSPTNVEFTSPTFKK